MSLNVKECYGLATVQGLQTLWCDSERYRGIPAVALKTDTKDIEWTPGWTPLPRLLRCAPDDLPVFTRSLVLFLIDPDTECRIVTELVRAVLRLGLGLEVPTYVSLPLRQN